MNSTPASPVRLKASVTIRPLREGELDAADRVMRLAFGTFLGMPDPLKFMGDADYVRTRWRADPSAVFAAEWNGELAGTNFATRWGSVAFFGPLTIRPELWDRGVAQQLLRPTVELFDAWGVRHAGLFTFANSVKHVGLYQKFGFWPRFLTALMEFPIDADSALSGAGHTRFRALSGAEKPGVLNACRELTGSIFDGLDVEREIRAVDEQQLGDALLTWGGSSLDGLAVCHTGAGTEAGTGTCYVKFAAARGGLGAEERFRRLLDACCDYARSQGVKTVTAGMNLARLEAYREMLQAGFRATRQGIVMERDGNPGYNHPGIFLIDDWR